ncbi:MAG: sugar transferase [Leptolyngbya sp. SIO3F4]|nr:sugar transferase [Leptolyngbya sp. SIO3F4]
MTRGIYTLANDVVYDQLIALLNSIEKNVSPDFPVCVIPYDARLTKVSEEIKKRSDNVTLFDDVEALNRWEQFAAEIWKHHPTAYDVWNLRGVSGVNRMGMHRRFCAFDGPFERYIYLDADTLVLGDINPILEPLDEVDWVVYDFQYKDPTHVFNVHSSQLNQTFSDEQLTKIFCAGMYAAKRGVFNQDQLDWLLEQLKTEADVLYINGPDQAIVNYMVLKLGLTIRNLSKCLPAEQVTGCCATSSHFECQEDYLVDRGKRLTYLHYIGIGSRFFTRLCAGENLDFPYRDTFLHYRYLKSSEQMPLFQGQPKSIRARDSRSKDILKRLRSRFKTALRQ